MNTPRAKTILPDRFSAQPTREQPQSTWQTIIAWIVETDRRFRMSQDRIDRLSNRF